MRQRHHQQRRRHPLQDARIRGVSCLNQQRAVRLKHVAGFQQNELLQEISVFLLPSPSVSLTRTHTRTRTHTHTHLLSLSVSLSISRNWRSKKNFTLCRSNFCRNGVQTYRLLREDQRRDLFGQNPSDLELYILYGLECNRLTDNVIADCNFEPGVEWFNPVGCTNK